MERHEAPFLVAVDDSDASRSAVAYTAGILRHGRQPIHLLHVLPPPMPRVVQHTSPDPQQATREHGERMLEQFRDVLVEGGVDAERVSTACQTPRSLESACDEILGAAQEHGCRTIVTGRTSLPWLQERLHHHLSDEIVRKAEGLTVWIVET